MNLVGPYEKLHIWTGFLQYLQVKLPARTNDCKTSRSIAQVKFGSRRPLKHCSTWIKRAGGNSITGRKGGRTTKTSIVHNR